jgi:hypothetical protein
MKAVQKTWERSGQSPQAKGSLDGAFDRGVKEGIAKSEDRLKQALKEKEVASAESAWKANKDKQAKEESRKLTLEIQRLKEERLDLQNRLRSLEQVDGTSKKSRIRTRGYLELLSENNADFGKFQKAAQKEKEEKLQKEEEEKLLNAEKERGEQLLVQLKGDFELIQETLEDFSNGPGLAHHYKEWAASQVRWIQGRVDAATIPQSDD